jgi:hypothetical protein
MPRFNYDDIEKDPDYEAALAAYVAAHPESPDAGVQRALDAPARPADVAGITVRRAEPSRAEQIAKVTAEGGDLTPFVTQPAPDARPPAVERPGSMDAALTAMQTRPGPGARTMPAPFRAPPPTPEGEAMLADLEAAGRKGAGLEDQPLPDVSMPSLEMPAPAEVPKGLERPAVQVSRAAHVNVPRSAVAQTEDRGAGGAPSAPPAADDPTTKALRAVVAGASPAMGGGDGGLEAALQAASGRRLVAGLARAGGAMVGRGNDPAYAQMIGEADRPLEDFKARRAVAEQDRQRQALEAAAAAAKGKEAFAEEMGRGKLEVERGELDVKRKAEAFKERKGAGGGAAGGLKPHEIDQDFQKLGEAVSTIRGRANLNRTRQESLDRADRLSALVLGPNGDIANLTPQQVREASTSLASLISNGSVSLSQIEELTPQTLAAKWANVKQKFLNEPQGADAQEFLRNMLETAGRETKVIKQQIHEGQAQGIPAFAHLRKVDPARYNAILKGAGLDPSAVDDSGLERPQAAAPSPTAAPGVQHPQAASALAWAKAHPGDPRAAQILQRLGVQ